MVAASKHVSIARRAILAAALVVQCASAHHSITGEFDGSRQVTVEGTVKEFKLINPHTYIVIAVDNDDGSEDWTLTFGPATKLIRGSGWSESTLTAGDRVAATGRPARKGLGLYLALLVKADGTVLIDELEE
jgi:DNA/RNA endonuclease YhcR with UshA esterase domain